jgi:hypothetical protein
LFYRHSRASFLLGLVSEHLLALTGQEMCETVFNALNVLVNQEEGLYQKVDQRVDSAMR